MHFTSVQELRGWTIYLHNHCCLKVEQLAVLSRVIKGKGKARSTLYSTSNVGGRHKTRKKTIFYTPTVQ